jgi:hypothetical protein
VYPKAPIKVWHGKMSVRLYTAKDAHEQAFGQAGFGIKKIDLSTEAVRQGK